MKQPDAVDGAVQLKYEIPNFRTDFTLYDTPVPVGPWRSVFNSQTAYANESFADELAVLAGKDTYEFRSNLLKNEPRLKKVLDKAAEISNWYEKLPAGTAKGIACHFCFGSYVSQVVQVTVDKSNKIKVDKVFAAVDCGQVLSPDMLKNQIEGGIVFALSAALQGAITLEGGSIKQKNFDTYEPLRYNETPEIEIYIDMNDEAPGGMGEPCVPCIAPALCNAIFAATGKRIRKLPVKLNM
jgi:isoquinoline 1-oxidoreductase beta subunit